MKTLIASLIACCGNFLVADFPYEFEQHPVDQVLRLFDRLCTKTRWRALDPTEQSQFQILTRELQKRALLGELEFAGCL
jgi:hypothetical protein